MAQPAGQQLNNIARYSQIVKPNNDTRTYLGLVLPNQLKVLLISDPSTDKSAASLSVQVGSLADPWDKQGLAHFLEHALFLSTKKYPEDNFFKNFVVQHGGHTNAYTSLTETVYYFDVAPNVFGETLDRFAQFFLEPLFPADKIERELQSVHFEFENTLTSDGHRFYRIRKMMAAKQHPFSKFEIGNKSSLVIDNILLPSLINFYNTWYSANIMALTVLGKESLSELEKMVVPLFSGVVDKNIQPQEIQWHPYPIENCRRMAKIVPFKEQRKMIMFFPLPDFKRDPVKCDALSYITFLLAHEGPGSLLAEYKAQGYCTMMDVCSFYYNGFGFLDFEVDLTQGIYANNQIIQGLFQYIKLLKSQPPQKQIYDEIRTVNELKFHYRDKIEPITYVKYLCNNLHNYPMNQVVCGRSLLGDFNPQVIMDILNLLTVNFINIQVISPIFKVREKNFIKDPIYGVEYVVEDLPQALLNEWINCPFNERLQLPVPNEFIPYDFTLKKVSSNTKLPEMIFSSKSVRVWHLQDNKYHIPKAFYGLFFKSTLVNSSPLNVNLICLFIRLLYDYIDQQFYSAQLVGITYSINTNKFGLELTVKGFNDKLDNFVYALLKEIINYRIDPKRYEIIRDIYQNELNVFESRPITSMLHFYLELLISSNYWTFEEMLGSFEEVSMSTIITLVANLLSHCQIEVFAHGNVCKEEVIKLSDAVCKLLATSKPFYPINTFVLFDLNRDVQLLSGITYELALTNQLHENNGFLLYFQIGSEDLYLRSRLELFHQLISEPYFNQIRMAEQLAYVTFVQLKYTMPGTLGLVILIQSAYQLSHLENRIEAFIASLENILNKMSDEEFGKEKNSMITRLSETPKSLFGCSARYWYEIITGQYIFDRNQRLIAYLKKINNIQAMTEFYRTNIQNGAPKCRRLIITIKSARCKEIVAKNTNSNTNATTTTANTNKSAMIEPTNHEKPSTAGSSGGVSSMQSDTSKSSSSSQTGKTTRIQISNVRKFKCENSLCRIPKIIIDKF